MSTEPDLDYAECQECGGDGHFDEPAAAIPTRIVCEACHGTGRELREYTPAGEDWISEESAEVDPAPSLNHGGPGICTLCHPQGRGLF